MGIGFAAPSNMARSVMDSLVKLGKVVRGWLGVSIQEVTPLLAKEFGLSDAAGALVSDVLPNSPAEKAGIKREDVIISFMGQPIENASYLRNIVARTSVGTRASVKIIRDKKEKEIVVTISAQPKEVAPDGEEGEEKVFEASLFGMDVQEITPEMIEQFDLQKGEEGVIVVGVDAGSPADEAGLREGDVIVEVNRKRIRDLKGYNSIFSKIKKGETVLLLIRRQGNLFFLSLTSDKE